MELTQTLNTILILLAVAVIPTLLAIAYFFLRPWLASKIGMDNLARIEMAVTMVVRAIDQQGKNMGIDGPAKKTLAFNTLKRLLADIDIPINSDLWDEYTDLLIEAKVNEIRNETNLAIPVGGDPLIIESPSATIIEIITEE